MGVWCELHESLAIAVLWRHRANAVRPAEGGFGVELLGGVFLADSHTFGSASEVGFDNIAIISEISGIANATMLVEFVICCRCARTIFLKKKYFIYLTFSRENWVSSGPRLR